MAPGFHNEEPRPAALLRAPAFFALCFLALSCSMSKRSEQQHDVKASPLYHELMAKPPALLDAITRAREPVLIEEDGGYMRVSTPLTASLNESPQWLGVTEAFRQSSGLNGKDVIVGIVDTGIDWTHPDFLGDDGRTRVLYILDYMLPAQMPDPHPEVDHGIYRIYGKEEIDEALDYLAAGEEPPDPIESADVVGHGTHVASIAVGRDEEGNFSGIAPGAWIVVVKAIRGEGVRFEDIDVADAVDFIFSVCDLYALPCVVNLSLGGQMGGHDGSSMVERAIEEKLKEKPRGRVVVAAAGNHGSKAIHAAVDIAGGREKNVELRVPDNEPLEPGGVSRVVMDTWIHGSETGGGVSVTVTTPSGEPISAGPGELVQDFIDGTWIAVSHSPSGPDPYNGDREVIITLTGNVHRGGKITPGVYAIAFHGTGAVDLYLAQVDLRATGILGTVYLDGDHVIIGGNVDIPATNRLVIAAGALTVKTSWTDLGGLTVDFGGAETGERALFSSMGPARDGAIKPDFMAPGEWIAAALSAGADSEIDASIFHGNRPEKLLTPDMAHIHSRGTSSAAPHITGLAALMLEVDAGLTADDIRSALIFSAAGAESDFAEAALHEEGFGIPRIQKAIDTIQGVRGGSLDYRTSIIATNTGIYAPGLSHDVEVFVLPLDSDLMPAAGVSEIEIIPTRCAMTGEIERIEPGLFIQTWSCEEGRAPPPGREVYFVAELDGTRFAHAASVKISSERKETYPEFETQGGGCSIAIPGM